MAHLKSLWGPAPAIEVAKPKDTKKIVDKAKAPKKVTVVKKVSASTKVNLDDRLRAIEAEVNRILGRYKQNTQTIKTAEELHDYITAAIKNGVISIDTETNNSLDPITCKLMGPCIYTPGQKNAYIPLNHIDKRTRERLSWQLTEEAVYEEFSRLRGVDIVTHNGKFDYKVVKCTTGYQMKVTWDTLIAAKMINENETDIGYGLKKQYIQKIDPTVEKYSIEHLFEDIEYAVVDPELFALYAATDPYMTFKLYEYQKKIFEDPDLQRVYKLFRDVEMPIMEVTAEMELAGVSIDKEYAQRLSTFYHKQLDDIDKEVAEELHKYDSIIAEWRATSEAQEHPVTYKNGEPHVGKSKSKQLENPVCVTSPQQLAILFYDVLKIAPVDKKTPRGTGEEILLKIGLPLCDIILKKRNLVKIINTYIDKLPACVSEKTGRLHASFNQLGAGTGRLSSSDPNLQNIPSHLKEIRLMFTASEGSVLAGADFSQQEVRLLADATQDDNMLDNYRNNRDIYATVASKVYNNDYWDNREFKQDGTPNPEGAERRSGCKSIVLGIMYQRGAASIAEQTGKTYEEAQQIINQFFGGFPKVKTWVAETIKNAHKVGYVEDPWGRRRHLPDILLPRYDIKINGKAPSNFNPLFESRGVFTLQQDPAIAAIEDKLKKAKSSKEVESIKSSARMQGIEIHENGGFIAQAERQSVNARIQGGAATLTKIAMIQIYKDQQLRDLGFKLLLAVHDELIGECPKENEVAVSKRLEEIMVHCGEPVISCPMACDVAVTKRWYEDSMSSSVAKEYRKLKSSGSRSEQEIRDCIYNKHPYIQRLYLDQMIDETYVCGEHIEV